MSERKKLVVNPRSASIDALLSDIRRVGTEGIYEVAAFVLRANDDTPTSLNLLCKASGANQASIQRALRFLKESGFIHHDPARMTAHGIRHEHITPTERLDRQIAISEDLRREIAVRDIRAQTGETRSELLNRAVGLALNDMAGYQTPDHPEINQTAASQTDYDVSGSS